MAPAGTPEAAKDTGPLKPAMLLIVIEWEAVAVGPTVRDVGVAVIGGPLPLGPSTVTEHAPVPLLFAESVTITESGKRPHRPGKIRRRAERSAWNNSAGRRTWLPSPVVNVTALLPQG